ncbi:MAG: transposase [Okeania sp. SIO1H6]|nr:transposase [Okeania sp. SIO1H6]
MLPKPQKRRPKPNANLREVVNGIFYIFYSGCHWRSLPHDLPPWPTISTQCTQMAMTWCLGGNISYSTVRDKTNKHDTQSLQQQLSIPMAVKTTAKSAPPALRFPQRKDGASRGRYIAMMAVKK